MWGAQEKSGGAHQKKFAPPHLQIAADATGWIRPFGTVQELVNHGRKFYTVDQLISRRACWSNAHFHGASLITALDNVNVVCSVNDQNGGHIEPTFH